MSGRLLILTYHRVLDAADALQPCEITRADFENQMTILSRYFDVLPLSDGVDALRNGDLPSRACSITFDDGYADNFKNAWPVLSRLDLPATLFVATDYLDGGRMWNDTVIEAIRRVPQGVLHLEEVGLGSFTVETGQDRLNAVRSLLKTIKYREPEERQFLASALESRAESELPGDLMLTSDQLRELAEAGMDIGGHTRSHPILNEIDDADASREISEGRRVLESIIDRPIKCFAYPNGQPEIDFSDRHTDMVRSAGFSCAVTTAQGTARTSDDDFALPRFGPWAEHRWKFAARLLRFLIL